MFQKVYLSMKTCYKLSYENLAQYELAHYFSSYYDLVFMKIVVVTYIVVF